MRGEKKIVHTKGSNKEAGVTILIPDKIGFITKYNKRERRSLNNNNRINKRRK